MFCLVLSRLFKYFLCLATLFVALFCLCVCVLVGSGQKENKKRNAKCENQKSENRKPKKGFVNQARRDKFIAGFADWWWYCQLLRVPATSNNENIYFFFWLFLGAVIQQGRGGGGAATVGCFGGKEQREKFIIVNICVPVADTFMICGLYTQPPSPSATAPLPLPLLLNHSLGTPTRREAFVLTNFNCNRSVCEFISVCGSVCVCVCLCGWVCVCIAVGVCVPYKQFTKCAQRITRRRRQP